MNMKRTQLFLSLLLLAMLSASAQQRLHLSVASFELEELDMDAQNHQKLDADGLPMAIVKVTSTNPDDDLRAYSYSFGQMRHEQGRYKDGELWIYVQRNAQHVSITRDGYTPVRRHDLGQTIQKGRVYSMVLSSETPKLQRQWIVFRVSPTDSKASVSIKAQGDNSTKELFGHIDETGSVAKRMPLGTYTYKVLAEGYKTMTGIIRHNDASKRCEEQVKLEARFGLITLQVDTDADIYVNGELKGNRQWTGRLNSGKYQVECRKTNYRTSIETILVEENEKRTILLSSPTPITGTLSVMSEPMDADIRIDNKLQDKTPCDIPNLLIGRHTLVLSKQGYESITKSFDISDGQVTSLNLILAENKSTIEKEKGQSLNSEILLGNNNSNTSSKRLSNNKYVKTAKTWKWIGWSGVGIAVIGLALYGNGKDIQEPNANTGSHDDDETYINLGTTCMVAGAAIAIPSFLVSAHYKKKGRKIDSTTLFQQDFNLKNGSVLSAGIDMLRDGMSFNHSTVGLGLRYSF